MRRVCMFAFAAIIFTFTLTQITPLSNAAQMSGGYLLAVCEKDKNGKEKVKGGHAVCQSYISGVIDYHNVLLSMRLAPDVRICIPAGMPLNTIHDVVLLFLRKHREHDSFVAAPAVTMALYQRFPCR